MQYSSLKHEEIEALFDLLDDAQVWIKCSKGRYLRVNRVFQENYSLRSAEAAIGLTDFDLSPPWLAQIYLADDKRVLQGERVINRIELVGGKGTSARWFRTTKIPLHDADGKIAATTGIGQPLPNLNSPAFPAPELAAALRALQDSPSTLWTNASLARIAGLSVSAFERKFRRHLQASPMQFLRRLRIMRSAAALIQTSGTISDIALKYGFSDQSHLSRDFKTAYGTTPREWRASHRSSD